MVQLMSRNKWVSHYSFLFHCLFNSFSHNIAEISCLWFSMIILQHKFPELFINLDVEKFSTQKKIGNFSLFINILLILF